MKKQRCKSCGEPKLLTDFRVVGPVGSRRRLHTCKSCQRRNGLGTVVEHERVVIGMPSV